MQETPQQYIQRILGYIEGKEPLRVQRETPKKLAALVRKLNKKQLTRKPAPGKWCIAEILAHLVDAEMSARGGCATYWAITALPYKPLTRTHGPQPSTMPGTIPESLWRFFVCCGKTI